MATSSAASCAAVTVSAITTATASPTWRTVVPARAGRCGTMSFAPPRPASGGCCETLPIPAISAAVSTSMTPGTALAAVVSIDRISANACAERTKYAWACSGMGASAAERLNIDLELVGLGQVGRILHRGIEGAAQRLHARDRHVGRQKERTAIFESRQHQPQRIPFGIGLGKVHE